MVQRKGDSDILNRIKKFIDENGPELVNLFFWFFLVSFVLDRIINYFFHIPFFVSISLIVLPFLFLITRYKNPDKTWIYVLVFSFLVVTILNSIIYQFGVKNISDFLFIGLFVIIYFYYKNNIDYLKTFNVYLFLVLILFLFSFTFFNINSNSISNTDYTNLFSWDINSLVNSEQIKEITPENEKIKWESNPMDILEYLRVYHNGLFRLPHVASYFFGFLALFFAFQYQKKKKVSHIALMIISLVFCIYTGSRAVLAAFVLSMVIYLFKRKYIVYFTILIALLLILAIVNDSILQLTKDTVFYQYFAFIQTTTENFTRLSRFRIWYSWWIEVREFWFLDFMIGKSYTNALIANAKNLDYKVWFHNDFLNIFYTYGIWCTAIYIWFFVKIYRDNRQQINQNIFIFIFYSSMVITAIINGFYYYFPVFLLYMFLIMIKQEKEHL